MTLFLALIEGAVCVLTQTLPKGTVARLVVAYQNEKAKQISQRIS